MFDGSDAMIEFMSRGNIRVIPESPAINLQIEPTEAQYKQIQSLVETLGWKNKEFTVDFDNQYGDTVDSLSYNGNVSARKVVADIQYYFKEGEIPQSELTSGYKAQYAKDSVGETQWHSGVVSSKLKGEKARKVILSRWFKPVRIVPNAEVAGVIAKILDGENISVPANVVTPSLRVELEKAGVKIDNNIRFALDDSDRDVRGNYTAGQRAKFAANNTAMKVYSRSDAESVISAIMDERLTFDDGKYGVLAGKNRTEVVDYLFKKLNTVKEGYRIGVALKIAGSPLRRL